MIKVTKRNGAQEALQVEKIQKMTAFACEGLSGVSPSLLEMRSNIQLYPGIKTSDIQETLIKAAADLISEENPNYQYVAGRLINFDLRKQVWMSATPPDFVELLRDVVALGFYDPEIFATYTDAELRELGAYVKHDRDLSLTYAAMEQFRGKYLVRNRITREYKETPQIAYMMIAATLFGAYPKDTRMKWVKDYYDAISEHYISLPTPVMAGVRTPMRQFSSCVLIESGDSLDSINATTNAIVNYVAQRAGIGIGAGKIRALGSSIRQGDSLHTGVIPFYKLFQAAVKSCAQGGVRGGSATLHYPIWHLEVEDLLVLKNNKGTEDTRVRHMDYSVQLSRLFYRRLLEGGNITLFSPSEVPGLYDAFFADQEEFERLYVKYENTKKIRKKVVKAIDLFSAFMIERKETGRVYFMNVDHVNDHGSFIAERAPIKMSNLCQEITLPTEELSQQDPDQGLIALCTLSATNLGKVKNLEDLEWICRLAVHGLDALLDYQNYPVEAARRHSMMYRPLGIGVINLAYWLAKNDLDYQNIDRAGLQKVHELFEAWSFYLISASMELARLKGTPDGYKNTKYAQQVLPVDTYKREVDEIVDPVYKMDWEVLRKYIGTYGIRNSTLMAIAPTETSAQVSNSTNGIEPPRSLVSIKQSKDGVLKQVVPEIRKLKNKYDLLWDQRSPEGYIKICAVINKFIDMSMSLNTSYNPKFYDEGQIPMSEMLRHQVLMYKLGIRTGYYFNTADGAGEMEFPELKPGAQNTEDCDACVI